MEQGMLEEFFSYLSILELAMLSECSYPIYIIVGTYRRIAWDGDRFLDHWFKDPISFRQALGVSDAIVTGIALFQFLDRRPLSDPILHIVCRMEGAYPMGHSLNQEGYVVRRGGNVVEDYFGFLDRISKEAKLHQRWGVPRWRGVIEHLDFSPSQLDNYPQPPAPRRNVRLHIVDIDPRMTLFQHMTSEFLVSRPWRRPHDCHSRSCHNELPPMGSCNLTFPRRVISRSSRVLYRT